MFLIFVAASKYGKIRMGRSDSKPEYNDISWFCMLFSRGIAVGAYTFACMETMTFYRHYRGAGRASLENDDDVAQAAILQLFYHWGFHAWAPYITVAITLGVTSYRWNLPLTMRSAFYPLLGNLVYSPSATSSTPHPSSPPPSACALPSASAWRTSSSSRSASTTT